MTGIVTAAAMEVIAALAAHAAGNASLGCEERQISHERCFLCKHTEVLLVCNRLCDSRRQRNGLSCSMAHHCEHV